MKLKEYFDETGVTICRFAKKNGISLYTMYNYFNGRMPSAEEGLKIEKGTRHRVTIEDIIKEVREYEHS